MVDEFMPDWRNIGAFQQIVDEAATGNVRSAVCRGILELNLATYDEKGRL